MIRHSGLRVSGPCPTEFRWTNGFAGEVQEGNVWNVEWQDRDGFSTKG